MSFHYPTDRAKASEVIALKIKAVNLDITMLQDMQSVLSAYKRKQINKYLFDALKEKSINMWHAHGFTDSDSYHISNFDRVLALSTPDRNGVSTAIYRDNVTLYVNHVNQSDPPNTTEIDKLKTAITQRLEGLMQGRADLTALLANIGPTLERYDALAKELSALRDIKGMWAISDLLPRI